MGECLLRIYREVLTITDAGKLVRENLSTFEAPRGGVDIIALGKAAVPMARAAQEHLSPCVSRGFVLTKTDHFTPAQITNFPMTFVLREAGHPKPCQKGLEATSELVDWLRASQNSQACLLVLLSGGTSSLLVSPSPPLTLADLANINQSLLDSGLAIEKINTLRKHLSDVKGGQLSLIAEEHYVQIIQLILSDVCAPAVEPKEIPSLVGSGPFASDPSTQAQARTVLDSIANRVEPELLAKANDALHETPFKTATETTILASHQTLLNNAKTLLDSQNSAHPDWNECIIGDIESVASEMADFATKLQRRGASGTFVASGEPTVLLNTRSRGQGGRCQELALRFAKLIQQRPGITFLAAGSDGTDGPTTAAGAIVNGGSWAKLVREVGEIQAQRYLETHDSHIALKLLPGALIETGPTGLNLNDLFLLSIEPPAAQEPL